MEPLGLEYVVILEDRELRQAALKQAQRRESVPLSKAHPGLGSRLSQALRSLATHVGRRERAPEIASRSRVASAQ